MATKKVAKKKPVKRRRLTYRLRNYGKHLHQYFLLSAPTTSELEQKVRGLCDSEPHAAEESNKHVEFIGDLKFINGEYVREIQQSTFIPD